MLICDFCGKTIKNLTEEWWDRLGVTFPNGIYVHNIAPICEDCMGRLQVECRKRIKELGLFKPCN